jgi:hypothetical protein
LNIKTDSIILKTDIMKKLSLLLALFVTTVTTVNAQDKKAGTATATAAVNADVKPTEAIARKQTDEMDRLVGLSDVQRQDIYNMNLTIAHRAATIKASNSPDKEKVLKEIENFRISTLMQKLNDEQVAKYKAAEAKR